MVVFQQTTNASELRLSGNMHVGTLGTGGKGELCRDKAYGFGATGKENGEEYVVSSVSLNESVLEGVWQLVSLNSNCCTCIV